MPSSTCSARCRQIAIGQLIGEIHNTHISVYQANGERDISAEETIEHIKRDVAISKAKAIKFKLGGRMSHPEYPPGRSEKLIPLVRKTFGDEMVISADANGSYTPAQAIPIGKLMQEYKYAFFEEPVPFDWYEETKQVADALEIPIAGGEQEPSTHNFRWLVANGALSIVQQDMFYFGGMVRCMQSGEHGECVRQAVHSAYFINRPRLCVHDAFCLVDSEFRAVSRVQRIQQRSSLSLRHFDLAQRRSMA